MSKPIPHPILPAPDAKDIFAQVGNMAEAERKWKELHDRRLEIIRKEQQDALRFGWEPDIWQVCRAILGLPCHNNSFLRKIQNRLKLDWPAFSAAMRAHLGFAKPVSTLLILGGNRSGKSEFGSKVGMEVLAFQENSKVYAFHEMESRSVEDQQPLYWKFMPPEWRKKVQGERVYIAYKEKTGFSESSFITPVNSRGYFRNYAQDRDAAIQGIEPDLVDADELIPPDWVDELTARLITRSGRMIIKFTPVNGYTPTVKAFLDGARPAKESIGYLFPKDRPEASEADEAAALGLSLEQYQEVKAAAEEGRASRSPESVPEDCVGWLAAKPESGVGNLNPDFENSGLRSQTQVSSRYESVPRVMRCRDPEKAVVFFHASDNPYGRPRENIAKYRVKARPERRMRYYGIAEKSFTNIFVKFSDKVHVLPAAAIPADGTNYMLCDPAGARNFFFLWMRARADMHYAVREWPGNYPIPGVGVPGPWAIPSGKKGGRNDGARGEGQESFGFGLIRYKFEIARLERWEDWKKWQTDAKPEPDEIPENDLIVDWDEDNGAEERIERRIIDSRAASNPRVEHDRPVTLQTELMDIGLDFELAPGDGISDGREGQQSINSALDYNQDEAGSFVNKPHLILSADMENTIFALQTHTGADGLQGASKEPIDLLRYYFRSACEETDPKQYAPRGGHSYGRRGPREIVNRPKMTGLGQYGRKAVFSR